MTVFILEKWECLDWIPTDDSYWAYAFFNCFNEKGFYDFINKNNLVYVSGNDKITDKIGVTQYKVTTKFLD